MDLGDGGAQTRSSSGRAARVALAVSSFNLLSSLIFNLLYLFIYLNIFNTYILVFFNVF